LKSLSLRLSSQYGVGPLDVLGVQVVCRELVGRVFRLGVE
jgi:hypothetical protein